MPPTLFSSPNPSRNAPLSVRQLVGQLKALVETDYGNVQVEGELSNFSRARSGHCYFLIKDEEARLECVMWRRAAQAVGFTPEDGMLVRLDGKVSIYEQRGKLQLYADAMHLAGEGALQKAFERLKKKLKREGLFDDARKRPLPVFPETIGLVTSGESAALQDLLTVLRRRFPWVRVQLRPVAVQGHGAGAEIAAAIDAFSASDAPPDVLIVGRGGGSAEDLWAFNEEVVARAIAACAVPVVSAVGHETDVSIADLVADRRAATPSMGAEVAVPDRRDVGEAVRALHAALHDALSLQLREQRARVRSLTASRAFHRPVNRLNALRQRLDEAAGRLERAAPRLLRERRQRLQALQSRLHALDPQGPLRRGFAFVEKDGRPVRTAGALRRGDRLRLRFGDGERAARVEPDGTEEERKKDATT